MTTPRITKTDRAREFALAFAQTVRETCQREAGDNTPGSLTDGFADVAFHVANSLALSVPDGREFDPIALSDRAEELMSAVQIAEI